MKLSTLVLLFLITNGLSGQTFTTLNSSDEVFFLTDSFGATLYPDINGGNHFYQPFLDSSIIAYKIDTNYIDSSLAEVFVFNKMHRYEGYDLRISTCRSLSFMGENLIKNFLQGSEIYHNALNEPIVYKTDAQLGESWMMFDGLWGTCMATLDSHFYIDTILGQADTVYSILCDLELYALTGTELRVDTILVGKRSGLIKMYSHYLFPIRHTPINLCGSSYPNVGVTSPDDIDYYDFNIGDEFHVHRDWGVPMESQNYTKAIYRIVDREENDSCVILYRDFEICSCYDCLGNTNYNNGQSTIKVRKNHRELLPLENGNFVYFLDGKLVEEQRISFFTNLLERWGVPKQRAIFECIGSDSDAPGGRVDFVKGLGMTSGGTMLGQEEGSDYINYGLVYYERNGISEGTPFDLTDCAASIDEPSLFTDLTLAPNPSFGNFTVEGLENYSDEFTLELHNSRGNLVRVQSDFEGQLSGGETLSAGLYFVSISNSEGTLIFIKRLLVLH